MATAAESAIWNIIKDKSAEEITDTSTPPPQPPDPVPSAAKVLAIIEKLKQRTLHGGRLGIARSEDVSTRIVRMVEQAIERRLQELAPEEPAQIEQPK